MQGPNVNDKKNIFAFKKKHRNYFIKKNRIYAKEKIRFDIKNFIEDWKKKNKRKIREMYILDLKIL